MNDFDTLRTNLRNAINNARVQQKITDENTAAMAALIAGRLRTAMPCSWRQGPNYDTLRALKTELRDFDLTTGKWKD